MSGYPFDDEWLSHYDDDVRDAVNEARELAEHWRDRWRQHVSAFVDHARPHPLPCVRADVRSQLVRRPAVVQREDGDASHARRRVWPEAWAAIDLTNPLLEEA